MDAITIKNNIIYVRVAPDWQYDKVRTIRLTRKDVIAYFARYSGISGFNSSYRFLGKLGGDWRPIDGLANECLAIFKGHCIDKLRAEARRQGLEPRF